MEAVHDAQRLAELQALPLERKIQISQARIIEWYQHYNGNVVVSFSGGKDSTVLLHMVRKLYPDVRAVFSNTGLEYPEIQKFAKSFDLVDTVTPKMQFYQVISTYGYPVISKEVAQYIYEARRGSTYQRRKFNEESSYCQRYGARYCLTKWLPLVHLPIGITHLCCNKTKKAPIKRYLRNTGYKQIVGTLAEESSLRRNSWIKHGCNAFDSKIQTSQPLSFWTEQDILAYIVKYSVEICSVYGDVCAVDGDGNEYNRETANFMLSWQLPCRLHCTGCDRTGCMFCLFGMHNEKGTTRFQRMAFTHPRQYEYSVGGGQWVDNPKYDPTAPKFDGEWQNWNPKKIWVPSKKGLGIGKVCDMVNEHYGKDFLRYE